MIEHLPGDSLSAVNKEAHFIKYLANGWKIDDGHVRVGVLAYDKEVKEHIHLDDYSEDHDALNEKLDELSSQVGDYGDATVVDAMDHARDKMYKDPRPGATKTAVIMVHTMDARTRRDFAGAARRLAASGITLYAIGVDVSTDVRETLSGHSDHYMEYRSWSALQHSVDHNNRPFSCHGHHHGR